MELGKLISTLTLILTSYETATQLSGGAKFLLEENKIYCLELTNLIFVENQKGQDFLKIVKLKDLKTSEVREKFNKSKQDVEKIVQEWEMVKNTFETMSNIMLEVDINIEMDNFKDKKFVVVTHKSFDHIKTSLAKRIKMAEENTPSNHLQLSII